jgi:hypothetical protein
MVATAMKRLRGKRILAKDGPIGVLNDLYLDPLEWAVRYLAVDSGERFAGTRLVIPAACAPIEAIGGDEVVLTRKRAQLRGVGAPEARCFSGREAEGCRIEGADGPAGRVEDILVGADWSVAGFVVAASNWLLPGAHVEMAPRAVQSFDRERRVLRVKLTHAQIQRLPQAAWRLRA